MRYFFSILTMALHAYMQGFYSTQYQKAIHGTGYGPAALLNKVQLVAQVLIIHNEGTLDNITMAAKIFGCRVHYNVCTQVERVLQIRRSKSVINTQKNIIGFGNSCNSLDIYNID